MRTAAYLIQPVKDRHLDMVLHAQLKSQVPQQTEPQEKKLVKARSLHVDLAAWKRRVRARLSKDLVSRDTLMQEVIPSSGKGKKKPGVKVEKKKIY